MLRSVTALVALAAAPALAAEQPLLSDAYVLEALMRPHRAASAAAHRRLQMGPPGGGGGPPGGGATVAGQTTSTACPSSTTSCTTSAGGGNFISRASLSWSTVTGTFSGSFVTNGCPNHAGAYQYGGALDPNVMPGRPNCIQQTLPAVTGTPPLASSLRGAIGYTISGGETIFGPMDNGFAVGDVCTNSRGTCPPGTDTRMCGALLERVCGTAGLKGNTTSTMHMLLSDCGGHAGYHNHEGLACEYSAAAAGHSTMVAVMLDGRAVFGMYETTGVAPADLDACGGHVGPTPTSVITSSDGSTSTYGATTATYHYHVQREAPFFLGCYGPVASLAAAMALYPSSCPATAGATCTCDQFAAVGQTCSCAAGSRMTNVCTSLGSYASYALDCPVYRQGSASKSQLNTTDPGCVPCNGNCPASASSSSSSIKAASGAGAAQAPLGAAAAAAALAVAAAAALM